MENLSRQATSPKPMAVYPFFDKIQFWVSTPLDPKTLAKLEASCGQGSIYAETKPARFNGRLRQRVELRQPDTRALQWLARHSDTLINRVEIALDYLFDFRVDRENAWHFMHSRLVRRWHGKKQKIRIVRSRNQEDFDEENNSIGTRYDASRASPNTIAFYEQTHSRITGEFNCLHLEWRLNKLKAVRRAGIASGQDLLDFDHRRFWEEKLLLFNVDKARLGRLLSNRKKAKKNRKSRLEQLGRNYWIDAELRLGENHVRAHDTLQELIDDLRPLCRISRALVPISNQSLLPARSPARPSFVIYGDESPIRRRSLRIPYHLSA